MMHSPDLDLSDSAANKRSGHDRAVTLHLLRDEEGSAFGALTYPSLAGLLAGLPSNCAAVGARAGGRPVGLALARLSASGDGDLLSLAVAKGWRCAGTGRRLASTIAAVLRERGGLSLAVRVAGQNPSMPALEAALCAAGWGPLSCESIRVIGSPAEMTRVVLGWKGVGRLLVSQGDVTFDPWASLVAADRPGLETLLELSGLSDLLLRVAAGDPDPDFSLVVRRRGEPVGWVMGRRACSPLADRPDAPTVVYGPAYMHPALAPQGLLIGGFWHAFTRQARAMGPGALAVYHTATPRMVALSRRRFAPIAIKSDEIFATTRLLN